MNRQFWNATLQQGGWGSLWPSCAGHPGRPQHVCRKSIPAQQQATVAAFAVPLNAAADPGSNASHDSTPQGFGNATRAERQPVGSNASPVPPTREGVQPSRQSMPAAIAAVAICQQLALFWCLGSPPAQGKPCPFISALNILCAISGSPH